MTPRPYLLFVRAGADSMHRRLIAEDPARNWDCCVSWYAPAPEEHLAEYYSDGGDNKLEGFLEFWEHRPLPWPYRYAWIIDDDIYLKPGDVSRFFENCERYGTYVSQPALRWFTHTTLNMFVRNPAYVLRRVSYVEAMAPCFSAPALEHLIHTFDWTKSTWGTDWAWSCLAQGKQPFYVLDAVAMEHTRTGDGRPGAFYRKLSAMGVDPVEELHRVERMFPEFVRLNRPRDGHVYRQDIPRCLAPLLGYVFERLKGIVYMRKQFLRQWRLWRARIEDLVHDMR
jgi:hypothetical protein